MPQLAIQFHQGDGCPQEKGPGRERLSPFHPRVEGPGRRPRRELPRQVGGSPPELAQRLAELGVVQVRVLVGRFLRAACAHTMKAFMGRDVGLALAGAVDAHRHGHQSPVVAAEHLADGLADAHGEFVIVRLAVLLFLLDLAQLSGPRG